VTRDLQKAIAVAKTAAGLIHYDRVFAIDAGRVHLSKDFFEANLTERELIPHSEKYDQFVSLVDGVRLFCLVPRDDADGKSV
jgi:hypothetical protein